MKKKMFIIKALLVVLSNALFVTTNAQVGINTPNPQGIFHMKNGDSTLAATKQMGMVLPIVSGGSTINSKTVTPMGTTAVEATVVYDNYNKCLRLKNATTWSDCLLDKAGVSNIINQILAGGNSGNPITAIKVATGDYWNNLYIGREDNFVYGMGLSVNRSLAKPDGAYPPTIILAKPAVDITAGSMNGLAVLKNGELWAWGENGYSRNGFDQFLLVGGAYPYNVISLPTKVVLPAGVLAARVKTFYNSHTFMLGQDGLLYSAGLNNNTRTGLSANSGNTSQFTVMPFFKNLKTSTGVTVVDFDGNGIYGQGVAVTSDGKLYVWGASNSGYKNLASGVLNGDVTTPTDVTANFNLSAGEKIVRCVIDGLQGLVLTSKDRLFGFGANSSGALGLSNTTSNILPTELVIPGKLTDGTEKIIDLAIDTNASIVATNSNVYSAGAPNGVSVLGVGDNNVHYQFTKMALSTIVPITTSYTGLDISAQSSLIITGPTSPQGGSKVYGAGYGYYNTLGGSVSSPQNSPANVTY
jgi:alpha-tubulin suppressor-like RCC1 family protein